MSITSSDQHPAHFDEVTLIGGELAADRQRVAEDVLGDLVRQLFATGLQLNAALTVVRERRRGQLHVAERRIRDSIPDLDHVITDLHLILLHRLLSPPGGPGAGDGARRDDRGR